MFIAHLSVFGPDATLDRWKIEKENKNNEGVLFIGFLLNCS